MFRPQGNGTTHLVRFSGRHLENPIGGGGADFDPNDRHLGLGDNPGPLGNGAPPFPRLLEN